MHRRSVEEAREAGVRGARSRLGARLRGQHVHGLQEGAVHSGQQATPLQVRSRLLLVLLDQKYQYVIGFVTLNTCVSLKNQFIQRFCFNEPMASILFIFS